MLQGIQTRREGPGWFYTWWLEALAALCPGYSCGGPSLVIQSATFHESTKYTWLFYSIDNRGTGSG